MSKLTLQDYQSKTINDLFMAVTVENVPDEEAKEYVETLTPQDENYAEVKEVEGLIDSSISEATRECNVDSAIANQLLGIMKGVISLCFEKVTPIICLKDGDAYINVAKDEEIDMTTHKLIMVEPFSDYYSENEYRFVELEGIVVLDVDSLEPWERYVEKSEQSL